MTRLLSGEGAPPLILVKVHSRKWNIYEPGYNFGAAVEFTDAPDRRYELVCTVEVSFREALERLQQLERGRR